MEGEMVDDDNAHDGFASRKRFFSIAWHGLHEAIYLRLPHPRWFDRTIPLICKLDVMAKSGERRSLISRAGRGITEIALGFGRY